MCKGSVHNLLAFVMPKAHDKPVNHLGKRSGFSDPVQVKKGVGFCAMPIELIPPRANADKIEILPLRVPPFTGLLLLCQSSGALARQSSS